MIQISKYLILAGVTSVALVLGGLSLAEGSSGMTGGIARGGMMGHGMQGCMRMMQGRFGGGSHRPNEQWRHL
jgi:hypothetical protein